MLSYIVRLIVVNLFINIVLNGLLRLFGSPVTVCAERCES